MPIFSEKALLDATPETDLFDIAICDNPVVCRHCGRLNRDRQNDIPKYDWDGVKNELRRKPVTREAEIKRMSAPTYSPKPNEMSYHGGEWHCECGSTQHDTFPWDSQGKKKMFDRMDRIAESYEALGVPINRTLFTMITKFLKKSGSPISGKDYQIFRRASSVAFVHNQFPHLDIHEDSRPHAKRFSISMAADLSNDADAGDAASSVVTHANTRLEFPKIETEPSIDYDR